MLNSVQSMWMSSQSFRRGNLSDRVMNSEVKLLDLPRFRGHGV
jgi:hypothetical protein